VPSHVRSCHRYRRGLIATLSQNSCSRISAVIADSESPYASDVSEVVTDGHAHEEVSSEESILELLRRQGHRVTTPRRLLIRSLIEAGDHRTADELAAKVQHQAPDVHISTIYRNLEELERLGVVVHSHLGHGPATYHLAAGAHCHFVCEQCGSAVKAPDELFVNLADRAQKQFGFTIDPHHFSIFGRCRNCQ
jgi:Fur family transcriptional regulator, ferric uptake regulator